MLEVKNLKLFYGDNEALHGINLEFKDKQITALIGPSGCGKSTLLRTLNRMHDDNQNVRIEGLVSLDGKDIYQKDTDLLDLRKNVGMVFQQPIAFPMSVYNNVAYGLQVAGIKDKAALDAAVEKSLKQAALWDEVKDMLDKSGLSLSGGQQQRLCIARALAVEPEILLLDEPTSALDPISANKVEETLVSLKGKYTMVAVTHNMQQAARISDWTAFMMNGDLVEYGKTKEMFISPKEQRTDDYLNGRFG
ncbi:phosphate ABC transporter ATP-binding protein, PhoT family [Ligilactobacillus sp. WC1T17]|uniref:Phosphate ABC transporter ATP-binding protein, PhoT family n=1 Tax=Ligilactobacillus ruminis TaxID=1623 RepID=A0ABY1AAR5_9LACO|nr:phosphate ABC transporter ATP-binding protein, PhoT family [Ligilactobacillus ruminis]